ncbi:hypothetical protein LTR66_000777 [Elasticomyces elasticus]|nr:hypothetical protein LTR66_000777 [Elasticomyces elasticus]
MDFVPLLSPSTVRPVSKFIRGEKTGQANLIRDNFTLTTWMLLGAGAQSLLFLLAGRVALLPAVAVLVWQVLDTYLMATGVKHNTYMDGIIPGKFSAQFPDESGNYGNKPANSEVVVFLLGARINHPMKLLAPGARKLGDYFVGMAKNLEENAEQFGFLGMSSWISNGDRSTNNELMQVCYFRSVAGLHAFAHSPVHREGWTWFREIVATHPHISIFHETYAVPEGHWESIYANSHVNGIAATMFKTVGGESGEERWQSPIVDASRGLLKTSAGRMNRSKALEHEGYGPDPFESGLVRSKQ